ncbi:MAG: hypothetical protein V7603_669 [Micromonosporaceae bacterium]
MIDRELHRAGTPEAPGHALAARWVLPVAVALSLVASAGTLVQVVVVGHTGAQAAWSGVQTSSGRR